MFYSIAGIKVKIHGESRMEPVPVSYIADLKGLCYKRQNASNEFNEVDASGEQFSPDASLLQVFTKEQVEQQLANKPVIENTARGIKETDADGNSRYVCHRLSAYKTEEGRADFEIFYRVVPAIACPEGEIIGTVRGFLCVKTSEGITLLNTLDFFSEYTVRMDFNSDFSLCTVEIYDMESVGGLDLETRLHSYIGEAFAYMALNRKRVVFHSSAIAFNGVGVCFSAPSGTGKSTHAELWEQYYNAERLNDDTPALYVENGVAYVCGTPWSGKSELNLNQQLPLKAIVFLYQSPDNKIERIRGMGALKKMLSEAKIPEFSEQFQTGLSVVSDVLSSTPVYALGCNISKDAVDLVKDTLQL